MVGGIAIAMFVALVGWGGKYFGWEDPSGKIQMALVTSFIQVPRLLVGRPISGRVDVTYPEPAHFQGFAHLWPGPTRFSRPRTIAR